MPSRMKRLSCAASLALPFLTACLQDEVAKPAARDPVKAGAAAAYAQGQIPWNPSQFSIMKGDFNGDGYKDLFYFNPDGSISIRTSVQGRYFNPPYELLRAGAYGSLNDGGTYLLGDMNGDGKSDLYYVGRDGDVHVRISDGSWLGADQPLLNAGAFGSPSSGHYYIGDMDGDGKSDLLFIRADGRVTQRLYTGANYNTERILLVQGSYGDMTGGQYFLADIDGDHKADLFFIGNWGDVHVQTCGGTYLNGDKLLLGRNSFGNLYGGEYLMGDFNGDGKADLFFIGNGGDVHVEIAGGAYYNERIDLLNAGAFGTIDGGQYYLGDFNGDGKADLFFIGNHGDVHVRTSAGTYLNAQQDVVNAGAFGDLYGLYE